MKNRVFITRPLLNDGIDLLRQKGFVVEINKSPNPLSYTELLEISANFEALITTLEDKIDQNFLEKNAHLKVVANYAVGFNNIDVECATRLKIRIGNTPDVLTEATAEIAFGLMIATSRNFQSASSSAKDGRWKNWDPIGHLGHGLKNKTLAIIGSGRIGSRLAEMARQAFQMEILSLDSKNSDQLHNVLKKSDFISLHLPLTKETKKMFGKKEFEMMKPNAVFINTARGDVVDQEALIYALKNKTIFAAGLDVTTPEPLPTDSELFKQENVFILPHIGSATFEARRAMSIMAAENVIYGLTGSELGFWVN